MNCIKLELDFEKNAFHQHVQTDFWPRLHVWPKVPHVRLDLPCSELFFAKIARAVEVPHVWLGAPHVQFSEQWTVLFSCHFSDARVFIHMILACILHSCVYHLHIMTMK